MEKVRYGIIGCGNMGSSHIRYLSEGKIEGAVLAAICDIKPEKMDNVEKIIAEKNPELKVSRYENYKDLLKSGDVDAVLIATPHYLHPTIGIEAFAANVHVLSEKPIGVYTKQVLELYEAAKKSDRVFGIMYNQRTNPLYQKVREIVQSGQLGELKRCVWIITNWYRTQAYYNSGGWRATWKGEGGGVLTNQCPHNHDLWQWMFGMPSKVRGFCYNGKYHDIEVEDDVTAYAEYANGATATFITTTGEFPGTNLKFPATSVRSLLRTTRSHTPSFFLPKENTALARLKALKVPNPKLWILISSAIVQSFMNTQASPRTSQTPFFTANSFFLPALKVSTVFRSPTPFTFRPGLTRPSSFPLTPKYTSKSFPRELPLPTSKRQRLLKLLLTFPTHTTPTNNYCNKTVFPIGKAVFA